MQQKALAENTREYLSMSSYSENFMCFLKSLISRNLQELEESSVKVRVERLERNSYCSCKGHEFSSLVQVSGNMIPQVLAGTSFAQKCINNTFETSSWRTFQVVARNPLI